MATGFIGSIAAKRAFFRSISEEDYRHFAQWGMSIQAERYVAIARFPNGLLIAAPGLCARQGTEFNEDYFDDYFSWFLHGSAMALDYGLKRGGLSLNNVRKRKKWLLRNVAIRRILFERSRGRFRIRPTLKLLYADYGDIAEFWMLCLPAMLTPGLGILAERLVRLKKSRGAQRDRQKSVI
jgi:hypothetical protein